MQRKLSQLEVEKKDLESGQVQLEKDRAALMKTLDKVRSYSNQRLPT